MPSIYLRHPVHGEKVATMEAEARYDEANGWRRFDPADNVSAVDEPAPDAILNEMAPKRRSRRVAQTES
jgi:hypothetical protein